jgi:zinc protease
MKLRHLFAGLALILCSTGRAAEPTAPAVAEGFTFVKTVGEISEYTLTQNGLQVLLMPARAFDVQGHG